MIQNILSWINKHEDQIDAGMSVISLTVTLITAVALLMYVIVCIAKGRIWWAVAGAVLFAGYVFLAICDAKWAVLAVKWLLKKE